MSYYNGGEYVTFVCYIVLALIGTLGNSFIIYVIYKNRMRSTTFLLVGNQAFSDLSCGLLYLSLWFICSSNVIEDSKSGHLMCDLSYLLKVSTFFVSVFSMMFISIDRYVNLCRGSSRRLKGFLRPIPLIIGTWILGIAVATLCIFRFRAAEFFTNYKLVACQESFQYLIPNLSPFFTKHWNILTVICLGCLVPVSITTLAYIQVTRTIRKRNIAGLSNEIPAKNLGTTKRTTEMLISTITIYMLLCIPLYSIYILHYYIAPKGILPEPCTSATDEPWYFIVAYFLAVLTICINPIIYCWFNQKFRKDGKRLFSFICGKWVTDKVFNTSAVTVSQNQSNNLKNRNSQLDTESE